MILPASYLLTFILLLLSMLCWGSWANTFKMAGRWRYELYYCDFAVGALLIASLAAMTFGSMGWDGFSFFDDLRNSGKRQELFAFIAGAVFNLGNMLLLAAVSIAGLSVAFPVGMGVFIIASAVSLYFTQPGSNTVFLALGSVAIAVAIGLASSAYRSLAENSRKQPVSTPLIKGNSSRRASTGKAILLAIASGILLGCFPPLVDLSRDTENGLGPYSIMFIVALAMVITTFVYNLFLMNLPVQGNPVDFGEYFKGTGRQHGLGMLGGMLFGAGFLCSLVAVRAEGSARVAFTLTYAMSHLAPVISALWGVFVWKEFAGADGRNRAFVFVSLLLLTAGIAAVALAPQFGVNS